MSFSRRTSRIYMDEYDIQGALKVLADRIEDDGVHRPFYEGARIALGLIYAHDDIRDQSVFMQLFDNKLIETKQEGLK